MTKKFIILFGRYRFFSSLSFYHGLDMFLATRDALVINGSYPGFFTSSTGVPTIFHQRVPEHIDSNMSNENQIKTHPKFDVALGVEAPLTWPIQNKALKFVNSGINYLYLNWRTNYLPSTSAGAHWFKYVQRKQKKNTSPCLRSGGAVDLTNPK